ncbi:MAG TPA: N-acetylmuramoyl-L-alanine amidase [Candidatus Hydrothermia bacterium]|nr:N-acetylmuramoyl-L-alanine amidase [Candidatus Hydrothermia bacterium]
MSSSKLRVVIDPGHGGEATGSRGFSGTLEKDLNLSLSKILQEMLLPRFEVFLTREGDVSLSLENRIAFATEKETDVFISIHFNADSLGNTNINRTEIYYPFEETGPSRDLAEKLYESFRSKFDIPCQFPVPSRYTVLNSQIPVRLLLEVSYLTNLMEEEKLKDISRLERVANIIYDALSDLSREKICIYLGFEIRDEEIRFTFSKPVSRELVYVRIDGKTFNTFYTRRKSVIIHTSTLRAGKRRIEILGKTIDGAGIPHVTEDVELNPKMDYFVASISPYTDHQLIRIKVLDKNLMPIPEGVKMSIDKLDASIRALRRGIYSPEDVGSALKAKKEISDSDGCFYILLGGLKDDIQIQFSVGTLQGRLSVENVAHRKSNVVGFVFDEVTKKPIKGALISCEGTTSFSNEFGIFELESSTDSEGENVSFCCDGYYNTNKNLIKGKPEDVYLTPTYNGVFMRKKVLIDVDNRDLLDSIAMRHSWKVSEYLTSLLKYAGGIPINTRKYPWQEVDDYTKVKNALLQEVDFAVQISTSKLSIKDGFYIFYYERSEESKRLAQKIKESVALKSEPEMIVSEYGNYFIIQLPGPRIAVNTRGLLTAGDFSEEDSAKFTALKIFLGLLSYLGFSGIYFREYDYTESIVGMEIRSQDFPISILKGRHLVLHFARPDSKIIVNLDGVNQLILNKPVEGTCIILPDGKSEV